MVITARVLLVDDEVDFTDALAARMEAMGLDAVSGANGPNALEMIQQRHYDVIVLDLQITEWDGIETFKCIPAFNKNLQIIRLTGVGRVSREIQTPTCCTVEAHHIPEAFSPVLPAGLVLGYGRQQPAEAGLTVRDRGRKKAAGSFQSYGRQKERSWSLTNQLLHPHLLNTLHRHTAYIQE
ncbi:response regulator [candidate division GN15 bacterium]|nr:response regulator [candidate division GN15 bacterium]